MGTALGHGDGGTVLTYVSIPAPLLVEAPNSSAVTAFLLLARTFSLQLLQIRPPGEELPAVAVSALVPTDTRRAEEFWRSISNRGIDERPGRGDGAAVRGLSP